MSRVIVMLCAMSLLVGVSIPAWGQDAMEPERLLETLATQIRSVLQADNVLGTPRDFDGTKIVPIIGLAFGFGAGSGVADEDAGQGKGVGLGGGGGVWPTALLVITKDGHVRVIPAIKIGLGEVIKEVVPQIVKSLRPQQGKEKDEENNDQEGRQP
jgi:uncharacterized spore protein YtfJ